MITTDTNKLEQGEIKSLFPNLGMQVISNGCICEIIGVNNQSLQLRVIEGFKSSYPSGVTFWQSGFLIEKK